MIGALGSGLSNSLDLDGILFGETVGRVVRHEVGDLEQCGEQGLAELVGPGRRFLLLIGQLGHLGDRCLLLVAFQGGDALAGRVLTRFQLLGLLESSSVGSIELDQGSHLDIHATSAQGLGDRLGVVTQKLCVDHRAADANDTCEVGAILAHP